MSSLSRKPSLCFLGINVSHESSHVSFKNLGEVGVREIPFDKQKCPFFRNAAVIKTNSSVHLRIFSSQDSGTFGSDVRL